MPNGEQDGGLRPAFDPNYPRRLQAYIRNIENRAAAHIQELGNRVQAAEYEAVTRIDQANRMEADADRRLRDLDPPAPAYPDLDPPPPPYSGPSPLEAAVQRNQEQSRQVDRLTRDNSRLTETLSHAERRIAEQDQQLLRVRRRIEESQGSQERPVAHDNSSGTSLRLLSNRNASPSIDGAGAQGGEARRPNIAVARAQTSDTDQIQRLNATRRTTRANFDQRELDDEYGADPFRGADLEKLERDALQRQQSLYATHNSNDEYGSDPFEGVDVQRLEREAIDRSRTRDNRGR